MCTYGVYKHKFLKRVFLKYKYDGREIHYSACFLDIQYFNINKKKKIFLVRHELS